MPTETGAQTEDEREPSRAENDIIYLSQPYSGTNLIACSMQAIVRKPIATLRSGQLHQNANARLKLDFVSTTPFIYRSHKPELVRQINSSTNKLIFVTRNLKEHLFRTFPIHSRKDLNTTKVRGFIEDYLDRLRVYDAWKSSNRCLVFYEDFIGPRDEEILLNLIHFIGEEPVFFDDYVQHKERYLNRILSSYKDQHKGDHDGGDGASASRGPKAIYYTENVEPALLADIDQVIEKEAPVIWNNYLKRFKTHL